MKRSVWKLCVNGLTVMVCILVVMMWSLTQAGVEAYTILSGSMEPALHTGDIVLVNTHVKNVQCEDIIAFYSGGNVVVHRVVKITEDGRYMTKGDANETMDLGAVDKEKIIGTVWISLHHWKWLWIFFTSKLRYWAVIIIVVLHVITEDFKKGNGGVVVGNP